MFTGIIEEVGAVREREGGRLVIACRKIMEGTGLGDSIAVNGVDLTVTRMETDALHFDCMPETYRRSNLGELRTGDPVNLERSVTPQTRLSGHMVRGVVEATGALLSLTPEGEAVLARYSAPPDILRHTVVKGPIAIDGVSLTVVAKDAGSLTVSLVQCTQENTNLVRKKPGDSVNLESDIIARYVQQYVDELLAARREG
jgi:riboflavin synthase